MTRARRSLGARGEDLAEAWYRERGYQILDRNWRSCSGEIDLVARRGPILVVCEVKTRSSAAFGTPAEAVTRVKQARLRRLAAEWLAGADAWRPAGVRFDVASVMGDRVEVLEAAF